jgi:hypothetical protein
MTLYPRAVYHRLTHTNIVLTVNNHCYKRSNAIGRGPGQTTTTVRNTTTR